ncbi:hypothetical protein [Haloarcula japonica]|uniref:hypothetical protein n=1 Tax=Haloarcula japonica TaxID=29282 RepID=UPI0012694B21|nr:hypothetical protein [Haloarcula japonica]
MDSSARVTSLGLSRCRNDDRGVVAKVVRFSRNVSASPSRLTADEWRLLAGRVYGGLDAIECNPVCIAGS